MNEYTCFLFDMDGVVVESMEHHAECWLQALEEYNLDLSYEDIFFREGMIGIAAVKDLFLKNGVEIPSDKKLKKIIDVKNKLFDFTRIKVYPYIQEIIESLVYSGAKIGLVTGSPRGFVEKVIPDDLLLHFHVIITADDVINGKPAAEPYEKAASLLKCDSGKIVVIENAPMGIRAANSAGFFCIGLCSTLSREFLEGASLILKSHSDLYGYIRSIVNNSEN